MARLRFAALVLLAAAVGFAAVYGGAMLLSGRFDGPAHLARGTMEKFIFRAEPDQIDGLAFESPQGDPITLADFAGKTVLVNLWATWCAPCVEELPTLDALQKAMGSERFEVLAINVDRGRGDAPAEFFDRLGIAHLALYRDPTTKIGLALGAFGLPTTVLFDAQGRDRGRLVGPAEWDAPETQALIRHFMTEDPAPASPGGVRSTP